MPETTQKMRTTFDVDTADLHLDFKDITGRNGSDMSKELNSFIKQYVDHFAKDGPDKNKEFTLVFSEKAKKEGGHV